MGSTVGYMVTWNTYGTRLQGDRRGWNKDGERFAKNERLREDNEQRLSKDAVWFGDREKQVVEQAIKDEAERNDVLLHAIAVCSNHVHVVVGYCGYSIEDIVRGFRKAGIAALAGLGVMGKVWSHKFDNRFCFDEESLAARIRYVNRHND